MQATKGRGCVLSSVDRALCVTLPESLAEIAGAFLMDLLGPFEVESGAVSTGAEKLVTLVFYPAEGAEPALDEVLAALPPETAGSGGVSVETRDVARDWVEGWRDHFRPIEIGRVRVRPPWEPAAAGAPMDVVINPGLGFGTGLHPTTRGTLQLLQLAKPRGPLVDAGTGSGILAIAAAKLGWHPIEAFDNDPVALVSTRENVEANGVQSVVRVHEADLAGAPGAWFEGATVLANMTLEPVTSLVRKLCGASRPGGAAAPAAAPRRLVVSGILAGAQECELLEVASECSFNPGQRLYEGEWLSLELLPAASRRPRTVRRPVRPAGG